jgi:hypothetical protein
MFQAIGAAHTGLLAEWSFDGDASDGTGSHDGNPMGTYAFTNEGAIPHDIDIPQVSASPTLDGICNTSTEYQNATVVTVDGTPVWLMHTADDMWVCFESLGAGVAAQVYLDADYTRLDPAQPEHLLLQVNTDDTLQALEGTGSNTYTDTIAADGLWDGDYTDGGGFSPNQAEVRIGDDLLGGWDHVIGLALGKSSGQLWPALADAQEPSTWSSSTLVGSSDPRTFAGQLVYQPRDSSVSPVGMAGVTVRLIGSDPGGDEAVVALATTNLDGSFSVTGHDGYSQHRLELGPTPRGHLAGNAVAGSSGAVIDAQTIDYGVAPAGTYASNLFELGDILATAADTIGNPYLLIIAPQHIIDSGALDEFVDYKRRVGFRVEVISVETVDATWIGPDRLHRIRALERNRFEESGAFREQYLMLVGTMNEIPFAQLTLAFTGYPGGSTSVPDLDACLDPVANNVRWFPSDWPYVDLVNDLDSNSNGCLLDGLVPDPKALVAAYYTPDEVPNLQASVAVGRIPFNTESAVSSVLTNIMRFEQKSEPFKRNVLFGKSHYWIRGYFWYPAHASGGAYWPCEDKKLFDDETLVSYTCAGHTEDAADYSEQLIGDFLNAQGYLSTILYEAVKADGSSPVVSPVPLTEQNLLDTLEGTDFGLVDIGGHGFPDGVTRARWVDLNGNNRPDSPTAPISTMYGDYSISEIIHSNWLINRDSMDAQLTPDNDRGAIYVMAACATGDPRNGNNFGANLLEEGHGVGWVGMMDGVSLAAPPVIEVIERLLRDNLRLGDAVWHALDYLCPSNSFYLEDYMAGTGRWLTTLYGDPTLSYWGNPGGQSLLAPWPMLRYDARGQGYIPLAGPEVPGTIWEYNATAPPPTHAPRSPIVSNNGEVIVAHGYSVDVLRDGVRFQELELDGVAYGTPAIAADGTIYAMDVNGNLYAFQYHSYELIPLPSFSSISSRPSARNASLGTRFRRWKVNLGVYPSTGPVIGADGFIAVAGPGRITTVRPDGTVFNSLDAYLGTPIDALAVSPNRTLYWATTTGFVARLNFFSPGMALYFEIDSAYSTPPLLAYGHVYLGRANGQVVKLETDTLTEVAVFQADGEITAAPVAGPGGQVLVGTVNGTLYSLTSDLSQRWQRDIGPAVSSVPAFSIDALYIVSNHNLRAYHPHSGEPLWTHNLGMGTGYGSAAVGYGREIYVQTSSGKVFAVGEGWTEPVVALAAEPVASQTGATSAGIQVNWYSAGSLVASRSDSAVDLTDIQSTIVGILLQRSADGGNWEDVAILPPGTTVYTDTDVVPNTSYAYRAQVLDSEGNDSDFVSTLVDVHSLPATPITPTLESVTTEASDKLGVTWSSPVTDVVSTYRIEHSLSALGPFSVTQQVGGGITSTIDTGLEPATDYYYRVVAINGAGEAGPSAVLSGTTRSLSLEAPERVTATLVISNLVEISWTPLGPVSATAAIEVHQGIMAGYVPLATVSATGTYSYLLGMPDAYMYRVKFVLDDAESPYTESGMIDTRIEFHVYLPLIMRGQ